VSDSGQGGSGQGTTGSGQGTTGSAGSPSAQGAPPSRRAKPKTPFWHSRRKIAVAVVGALALIIALGGVAVLVAYRKLNANITSEDVSRQLGTDRPPVSKANAKHERPLDILLIGSDTRKGNPGFGKNIPGQRSDTQIILHLSAARDRATMVSIPRDSIVRIPRCPSLHGGTQPPRTTLINEAYSEGGSACTIKTLEKLTHIRIDHHVVVDFDGFKRMIDALGGVQVCLPQAVNDPKSKLKLPAGKQTVKGKEALAFVRARKTLGDGSDLSRIKRQQAFLGSMISEIKSTKLLLNPVRLYRFLDAATKSVTTDPGLSNLNTLRKLAQSVKGIDPANVSFVTVPVEPYPSDPNRVQWAEPAASRVWKALRADKAYPPPSGPKPVVTVAPKDVRVQVLNGTNDSGAGKRAAKQLRAKGFDVTGIAPANRSTYAGSLVRFDPGYDRSGDTLTSSVIGASSKAVAGLGGTLQLVVGSDYHGVRDVKVKSLTTSVVDTRKASDPICS
jgi:LCP family protein required for cell wall assembly